MNKYQCVKTFVGNLILIMKNEQKFGFVDLIVEKRKIKYFPVKDMVRQNWFQIVHVKVRLNQNVQKMSTRKIVEQSLSSSSSK
jgi:hypothetical protein